LSILLAAGLTSSAQAQQGVSLVSGFTDFTTWNLYGSASASNATPGNGFTDSSLALTQIGVGGQAGAGFAPTALAMDFDAAFGFDFHFQISANNPTDLRGDGLTLTLANAPGVGNGGSGLGYENIGAASVAFAIDTFHFDGEPVSPSLQILSGGNVSPLATTETGPGDTIREQYFQWYPTLDYTPSGLNDHAGLLTGSIENLDPNTLVDTRFAVSAAVDFNAIGPHGSAAYYGFTAGNGLATDGHFIHSGVPMPEPQTWALLIAGLAAVGLLARRRRH
jgi:hypothetical protein